MPLLVVPLGSDEADLLTLREWDAVRSRRRVAFEDPAHPLRARLQDEGVEIAAPGSVSATDGDAALVAEPSSETIGRLAEEGADISSGSAESPDALTAARGAYVGRRSAAALSRLALIMARLRGPGGCPWDAEQTHQSLRVHLQEEAHEVLEAIDEGRLGADLEEELGDLLLQVAFHAQMAADDGRFDLAGVADSISTKLIRRHPHVFGDVEVSGAGDVVRNWEEIKRSEKERASAFDGIPAGLPALLRAYKMQKRAAGLGFSADLEEALGQVAARLGGALEEEGLGEMLFWLVAAARASGVDPEAALRSATNRLLSPLEGGSA